MPWYKLAIKRRAPTKGHVSKRQGLQLQFSKERGKIRDKILFLLPKTDGL